MDVGRLSSGERAGLGRLSREDGGVDGPPVPRPFVSFSLERWEPGGARDGGLREEGEEEEGARRLRQGIFSRLTTGRETLERREEISDDTGSRIQSDGIKVLPRLVPSPLWWIHRKRGFAEAGVWVIFGDSEGQRVPWTGNHRGGHCRRFGLHGY